MPLVRVKHAITKAEYSVDQSEADRNKQLTVIDKPAVYVHGQMAGLPLPPKSSESIAEKVATRAASTTTKPKEA